ncbi:MAG: hypothetical protein AAFW70_27700 [Cyanobacteria bacterium J06635_10]
MKNQLLIPSGILIALLYITGCTENNSNSDSIAPVETSNPIPTATPISQPSPTTPPEIPTTVKLGSGIYCYTAKTKTLDADAEIIISPSNQVSGTVEATIHNDAVGYYTSYNQTLKGTLEGEKAKLDIVTKIEYDTQNAQETWTITESSLNTGRENFKRVDCANLINNNSTKNDNPAIKPVRVSFDRGSTSKTIKNAVVRGTRDTYLLGAKKGQQMNLKITSLEKNAVFDVISPNGKSLQQEATNWSGKLPKNGDYQVVVGGTRGNASYELTVEIK